PCALTCFDTVIRRSGYSRGCVFPRVLLPALFRLMWLLRCRLKPEGFSAQNACVLPGGRLLPVAAHKLPLVPADRVNSFPAQKQPGITRLSKNLGDTFMG